VSRRGTSEAAVWLVRGAAFAAGALAVAGLLALAWAAGSVLILIFVALLFATALEPFTDRLRDRLPTGRAGTIAVTYLAFFAIAILLVVLIVPIAAEEAGRVVTGLPKALAAAEAWAMELEPPAAATVALTLIQAVQQALEANLAVDSDAMLEAGIAGAEIVVGLATAMGLAFFWLIERARLQRYVLAFVAEDRRAGTRDAWNAVAERLGLWVRGQLTLMAAMGVATAITYSLLGVPAALLLAVIAAVTEVIPIIGPLLGAIPAIAVAATVSPELAVVVGVAFFVLQAIEGLVLVPIVMRNAVGLSPFLILASVLIGAAAGGIVGALLAIPIAAALEIIVERFQERDEPIAIDPRTVTDEDRTAKEVVSEGTS
jgi:predicted PurR-regulated permease PerM